MMLRRAVVLGTLLAAAPAWAGTDAKDATAVAMAAPPMQVEVQFPGAADMPHLTPRQPLPKRAVVRKPAGESRLAVKFKDSVKARPTAEKNVESLADTPMNEIDLIAARFGVEFVSAFGNAGSEVMDNLRNRAAARSGKQQPDLGGMMFVEGPEANLEAAAAALNASDLVEFAYFQIKFRPTGDPVGACCVPNNGTVTCGVVTQDDCETQGGLYQGDGSTCLTLCPDPIGGCCLNDGTCVTLTEADCTGVAGSYAGDYTNCELDALDCNSQCGNPLTLSCFDPHPTPFCDNQDCCELVCEIRPFCCRVQPPGEWDDLCVALAHLVCDAPPADRCLSCINGSCFEVHATGGCNNATCCATVCALEPFCCEGFWADFCVDIALDQCALPPSGGTTPDLTAYQGYLRTSSYAAQPGGIPPGLPGCVGTFAGTSGEGMTLFNSQALVDSNSFTPPERYEGLYGLGRELLEVYSVGSQNRARGQGIKVAVIEWGCFQHHEDLNLHVEPGQTIITIDDIGHPTHATACLGIIGAVENGFGVTGVAPDAELWFFPLTSVEEGPREMQAFLNCYNTLQAGDVVSCSFGPPPTNLALDNFANVLITLGTDLGIVTCVAAGNSCFNLDNVDPLPDSGAVVVGAGDPGGPHCRLTFSNYFSNGSSSQVVHVHAWGEGVATLSHVADLFNPTGNPNRQYTVSFNGTSAACPQVAGAVACLQGLAKQFYGIPISPQAARNCVTNGTPQCGIQNPDDLPGFDEAAVPCAPDINFNLPPHKIGPFINPRAAGAVLLNQNNVGFGGSPNVDNVFIIRGSLISGNVFSIKGSDNNYLVVRSLFTDRRHRPNIANLPESRSLVYMGSGQTADIVVDAHAPAVATTMNVVTEVRPPGPLTFLFVELYDWTQARWKFVNFVQLPANAPVDVTLNHQVNPAQSFISPHGNRVLIRVYTFALGNVGPIGTGPGGGTFDMLYDLIDLQVFTNTPVGDGGLIDD